jgi:cobalt-zinc-cadmium resistance protein CzcA
VFRQNKEELIAAMDRELEKIPGALWNFSQPIADNMEEAVSGVKGQLAIKIYGDDLKTLEAKGDEIVNVMKTVPGVRSRPVPRDRPAQPGVHGGSRQGRALSAQRADVQDAIETAVGGKAVSQVLQGEQRYDLVVRYQAPYRNTKEAIENIRLLCASGERVSLAQLCSVEVSGRRVGDLSRGQFALRGLKYSVRGRDLGSTVEEAIAKVGAGEAAGRATHRLGGRI